MAIESEETGLHGNAKWEQLHRGITGAAARMPAHSAGSGVKQQYPVFWMRQGKPATIAAAEPGASAQALLSEVAACAARFAETGKEALIDLRCLKSMPEECAMLAAMLGRGEVTAVVRTLGNTEIHETSIPCVWWIKHRNTEEETVGELIEIAAVPEVIAGDSKAIGRRLETLRSAWPSCM
ncbi:MAG TPA: hydrogenase expression/formation C-terminal domain-containing protein [Sideroxyarcus sp.]|nr:hydrogenase expression/formation C-terminal domain-containing protein [Sideroxyarcus sp.]